MDEPPAANSPEIHVTQAPPPPPRHPIGTLIIVAVYGLLFVLGWLAIYFFVFRARGAVGP